MKPESIEFFALLEAAGWTPAEAARRLDMDRSVISQYKSGSTRPSSQTLSLLKMILSNERPGALAAAVEIKDGSMAAWERRIVDDLRWLHKEDRERVLDVVRTMIRGLPKREPVTYGSSHTRPQKTSAESTKD